MEGTPPNDGDWGDSLVYVTMITGRICHLRPKGNTFLRYYRFWRRNWKSYAHNPKRIKKEKSTMNRLRTAVRRCALYAFCENINRYPQPAGFGFAQRHTIIH